MLKCTANISFRVTSATTDTHLSTRGSNEPLAGPFVKSRMTAAGTAFRHASRAAPGDCVQFSASANASNELKEGVGIMDTAAPESMMPARNGAFSEWRDIASLTDWAPADCP